MTAAEAENDTRKRANFEPAQVRGMGGRSNNLFWMLLAFLMLEYIRPPVIVQFKLQMLITIILPLLCFRTIKNRPHSRILTLQICFFALSATHVLLARNYYSAYMVTRSLYGEVAIAFCMAWLLAERTYFKRGMWAWTLIMTYVGVFGITHGGVGPGGFLGDENDLALACNTALPMAYFGLEWAKGWRRWAYGAIGAILVMAVVATLSRGGFLGLAAMLTYCFLVSKHKLRNLALMLTAGVALLVFAPSAAIEEVVSIQREASGEVELGTGNARLFLWQTAFNMWKDNPVLGVGGGNFNWQVGEYQPDWEDRDYSERNWSGQATHSLYFQLLAEQGAAGVFIFLAIVSSHFFVLRRVRIQARNARGLPPSLRAEMEMYSGALAGAMVGYLASGAFLSVVYYPYPYYLSGLAVALAAWVQTETQKRESAWRAPGESAESKLQDSLVTSTDESPASLGHGLTASR